MRRRPTRPSLVLPVLATAVAAGLTTRTYAYGTDPQQRLDAYYAASGAAQSALVIVHGGHWRAGHTRYIHSAKKILGRYSRS